VGWSVTDQAEQPAPPPRIIIADDVAANRRLMAAIFQANEFDAVVVDSGVAVLEAARARRPDVVLLDLQMPGMDGIETLTELRAIAPTVPVLILTAYGEISVAVEAIRLGADDFLTRPISNDELVRAARRAVARAASRGSVDAAGAATGPGAIDEIMGRSDEIAAVVRQLRQVAPTDVTVLLLGETGVGKDVMARALHAASGRADRPMISVDCGAIPDHLLESELFGYERGAFSGADRRKEGRFELAAGSTLFLDEIGNLSAFTQAKLLRVLQERQVHHLGGTRPIDIDCRVIAATNEDLMSRVADGRFRADLYYRLAEFVIHVPPLRARRGDIGPLVVRFVAEASAEFRRTVPTVTAAAHQALAEYHWPGNVRELRNVVRQAVLRCRDVIDVADVAALIGHAGGSPAATVIPAVTPPAAAPAGPSATIAGASLRQIAEQAVAEAERVAIVDALRKCRGNKTHAARLLQVDFKTLHSKMKRLGLSAVDDDDAGG
jgi:two-component system response regulator HydG